MYKIGFGIKWLISNQTNQNDLALNDVKSVDMP